MNQRMTRTVKDKAEQIARRWLRARDKDITKKRDFWMILSIAAMLTTAISTALIFLI